MPRYTPVVMAPTVLHTRMHTDIYNVYILVRLILYYAIIVSGGFTSHVLKVRNDRRSRRVEVPAIILYCSTRYCRYCDGGNTGGHFFISYGSANEFQVDCRLYQWKYNAVRAHTIAI